MAEPNGVIDKVEKALKDLFVLHLYVANMDSKSVQAIKNIKDICEEKIPGRYRLDIIDIYKRPGQDGENQIIAAPTLLKESLCL
jgi:circadian clock protein KaiB